MIKNILFAVSLFAGCSSSALAESYLCNIKDASRYHVIPSEILVEVDQNGKGAMVTDAMIKRHASAPLAARRFSNTDKVLKVAWRIEDALSSSGQKATLDYSLVFRKTKGKAFVTFAALGYPNTNQGTGSCRLVD